MRNHNSAPPPFMWFFCNNKSYGANPFWSNVFHLPTGFPARQILSLVLALLWFLETVTRVGKNDCVCTSAKSFEICFFRAEK